MKRFLVFLLCLVTVATLTVWATGSEESAPQGGMDKIVLLTTDLHEFPEFHEAFSAEWERMTGIPVELRTVSSAQAGEAMIAQFMAGDLPDVVKYGESNLAPLARQEFIIPLDEFIEDSPGMSELKAAFPSSFRAHEVDGVSYGIPTRVGSMRGLWARTDILDSLGIEVPTTFDEFVSSLIRIRDEYPGPDGNPMFPYISKTYHGGYMGVLANYFDVSIEPVIKRPGDTEYRDGWDSPQFRDYAEFMRMLWDENLIDPDHALPQKASTTRSKFYAGQGAYLSMWAYRYSEMLPEIRKQFPEAEIAMVPPIVNPNGGILGASVLPGYRPYAITSRAGDPEFVFETFFETMYLTAEGAMLQWRGLPDIAYTIQNNMFVPNTEETGVHMGVEAPLNPNIVFPYSMSPLLEAGALIEQQFGTWFSENSDYAIAEEPTVSVASFDLVRADMDDKKQQLFWKYVIGEFDYDEMMRQYEEYKQEIEFDGILAEINSAQ